MYILDVFGNFFVHVVRSHCHRKQKEEEPPKLIILPSIPVHLVRVADLYLDGVKNVDVGGGNKQKRLETTTRFPLRIDKPAKEKNV